MNETTQIDGKAFFKLAYGLYVITTNDGERDNGMICNTVVQVTADPPRLAVTINKANYTHDTIRKTGRMNVCALAESAKFPLFQLYGFQSGRTADKFAGVEVLRTANGLAVLAHDCNAYYALEVESYSDLGTHGLFVCKVTEAKTLSDAPTMTYAYYHAKVKPQPKPKKGWVCKICGYVYEGDELPADYICPLCKHPASDFERIDPAAALGRPVDAPEKKEGQMKKYVCKVCGYVYDPAANNNVAFEDLPDDWICPLCGVGKDQFEPVQS